MATYRIRNLFCVECDEPVRVRNLIVGDSEVLSPCPECRGHLVALVGMGRPQLASPQRRMVDPYGR
jgi:hypothetical protein